MKCFQKGQFDMILSIKCFQKQLYNMFIVMTIKHDVHKCKTKCIKYALLLLRHTVNLGIFVNI